METTMNLKKYKFIKKVNDTSDSKGGKSIDIDALIKKKSKKTSKNINDNFRNNYKNYQYDYEEDFYEPRY